MPDTPEKEAPANSWDWGTNERGDLLIDGVVVEPNTNFQGDVPDDTETVDDRKNAVVEGEEAPAATVPEPEPEKAAEPASEPAKITEKQKYKLMVRGEFVEKEYAHDELVARLQMAESYDLRNDELRQKHRKIEPFMHIFERPDFKEWVEGKMAVGDIPSPTQPEPVSNKDVIEYRLRTIDPEFAEINQKMVAWAATLPDQEAEILNRDHASYVRAFDQFKAAKKSVPAAAPTIPKREVERSIAAKEVIKAQARVEPPGGAEAEPPDPQKEWAKVDRQLKKAVQGREKYVIYNGQRMDPEMAWVMHRTG